MNQPQLPPDKLRSSLGFLTNLQEHLLNHQHPEIQAGKQAQEAQNSPQEPVKQEIPQEPPKDEAKEMDAFKALIEPLQKSIEEIKNQLKPEDQQIAEIRKELETLTSEESNELVGFVTPETQKDKSILWQVTMADAGSIMDCETQEHAMILSYIQQLLVLMLRKKNGR